MTNDDIIRMARDAGFPTTKHLSGRQDIAGQSVARFERFAAVVASAEREACAQACEEQRDLRKEDRLRERSDRAHKWESIDNALRTSRELADVRLFHSGLDKAAAAIRARGHQ